MLRVFQNDLMDSERFVVTMELVPGREPAGRSVDQIRAMAQDAFSDGRVSAVSITDNPGGNPSLSPDVIGHEIFRVGMDVIVHFTCRDTNRVGLESRALQLALMGMKNILALTGDYTGQGFAGRGAPVFDLDSVTVLMMLRLLDERIRRDGDPDVFFTGCAVSPFKSRRGEAFAQYAKLCRKMSAGARFVITQLGFDIGGFQELLEVQRRLELKVPTLATVYLLTPASARIMNSGQVPGAWVSDELLAQINAEWKDKDHGRAMAVERAARLAAVLKGIGYRGIHLAGVHRGFETVGRILDRIAAIESRWRVYLPDFSPMRAPKVSCFGSAGIKAVTSASACGCSPGPSVASRLHFRLLEFVHTQFFSAHGPLAPALRSLARLVAGLKSGEKLVQMIEDPAKSLLLACRRCGDCAIQHVAFLCPESQCPKHIRNGACGGSRDGCCEVYPDRKCVWVRAVERWMNTGQLPQLAAGCVPPRLWELDGTSSWMNFHLERDHQSSGGPVRRLCLKSDCRMPPGLF